MNYDQKEFDDVIRETSFDIIREISPDETGMFDEAYKISISGNAAKGNGDNMLGFGVDALSYLTTPAVVGMVSPVAGFLFSELAKSLKDEATVIIKAKIKERVKKDRADERVSLPVLTKEQLASLEQIAFDSAKKNGADDALAEKMSLTLIGTMNLPQI